MDKNTGFAKFPRSLLKWDYYKDLPVKTLYFHCLFKANYKDNVWRGIQIKRGQFVTSYKHLSVETGLTLKQVRRAIFCLQRAQLIEFQGHNNGKAGYSVVTVFAYDCENDEGTVKGTVNGKPKDNPRATDKKDIHKNSVYKEKEEIEDIESAEEDWFIPHKNLSGQWIISEEE